MVTPDLAIEPLISTLGELTITLTLDEALLEGPGERTRDIRIGGDAEAIREWARFDSRGRYRPLSGARTLRPDWYARFSSLEALTGAVEGIYPLAYEHIAAATEGRLRVTTLEEALGRQGGRYESAAGLSPAGRDLTAALLCGGCVRTPAWRGGHIDASAIPCPEPCSVLVAFCREAAAWEAAPPAAAPIDPMSPFAAFDSPGNELRERCLRMMGQR